MRGLPQTVRTVVALLIVPLLADAARAEPQAAAGESGRRVLEASDLGGLRLRTIGPAAMSGRFVDIAVVESDPFTFYVASATGGVFRTDNNGVTYTPVFEREATHSVGDIAVHQGNPDIVWVGTGERANRQSSSWGDGVYKSTDAGKTWTNMGLGDTHHIGRVLLHPDDNIVFVAAMGHLWGANEERGLYRTRDGGESWDRILYIDADTGIADVAMHASDPDVLYAAAYQRRRTAYGFHGGGPGSGLYKSTNGGETWTELTAAALDDAAADNPDHPDGTLVNGLPAGEYGRIGISIYRSDPDIVYVSVEQGDKYTASTSYEGERFAGVYRSEDRGETWTHMSDWNPRPMYASQILVDPSDDQRIYQHNSFSYSDDGGKTWTVPRQSIHADDRFLWVNPNDSRHLIKASDGAIGISYDRAETWLWASNLPVSQYYRVAVDMADPYNVYGGLQDNGAWMAPNETYRSEGVLNQDWRPIGGGDGFIAIADPADPDKAYAESQYLGLTRLNLRTFERRSIRPGNPVGYNFGRRNWRLYGTSEQARVMEQSMAPGNWDGPFIVSPHDPHTLYAGLEHLFVSRDGGASWTDLGRMSEAWERSEIEIMGQAPTARVASLDDGVPYFATATIIAESPLVQGLLFIGTDDGNVQISRDGGATFVNVAARFPGLPARTWVADLEPSPHDPEVVFAAFDGHREDDFANYAYRSDDGGATWTSVVGDLPAAVVVRALQQDVANPDLLYLAAEIGFYVSIDGGAHWVELKNNMPTLPFNDFVVHRRDHDLVLGSHGRGVWILDSVLSLRGLDADVVDADAHLFAIDRARMTRRARTAAQTGDTTFRGQNPPVGAIIDYWLRDGFAKDDEETAGDEGVAAGAEGPGGQPGGVAQAAGDAGDETDDADEPPVKLTVHGADGELMRTLEPRVERGINRVVWDLRSESLPRPARIPTPPDPVRADGGGRRFGGFGGSDGAPSGPLVVPGTYTVRLTVGGAVQERTVDVSEDPRIDVDADTRRAWTALQIDLGALYVRANELVAEMIEARGGGEDAAAAAGAGNERPNDDDRDPEADTPDADDPAEILRGQAETLRNRILGLRGQVGGWVGPPTADQESQRVFYLQAIEELTAAWQNLRE